MAFLRKFSIAVNIEKLLSKTTMAYKNMQTPHIITKKLLLIYISTHSIDTSRKINILFNVETY
ncbi:hypothetical protein CSG_14210 [Campylobacter fetus subsp. venerealis str. 84-112]|nr:hypothetical protein CSG_14210 [Campylobacter fetus subsp. venerealis str. 84-112]